jgi:uncharacterized protein (DUF2062 family)
MNRTGPVYGFWNRQIGTWFTVLSFEGVTADTIALSVALGLVFGIFPVYGCPTLLCAAAALILRLNAPAIQFVNYLTSPLQLALFIPFNRVGERLFPSHAAAPEPGFAGIVSSLSTTATHAIVGWFCLCAPLGIFLYLTLGYVLRRCRGDVSMERDSKRPLHDAL